MGLTHNLLLILNYSNSREIDETYVGGRGILGII